MTEECDPILTFFSSEEAESPDLLYTVLRVEVTASSEEISKAYRKMALRCHPDKHAGKSEAEKQEATTQFQRIGFAFAVLSDDKRRKRYDATGRTEELAFGDDVSWDAYFNDLFERVDRRALDADKKKYQGSADEVADLVSAYTESKGDFDAIMAQIPHSTYVDEERFVTILDAEISAGRLEETKKWKSSSRDKKARKARKRAAEGEAAEAEEEARRLGVWDEFYGSGAKGRRGGDAEEKGNGKKGDGGEDGLAALIRSRQASRGASFAALEAKYAAPEKKGKKGKKAEPHPDELDDDAFEALQAKMFGGEAKKAKKAESHHDDLDDAAFEALQAKMFGGAAKKRKTK